MKFQKKVLFDYLARNKQTEYGLKYDFPKIQSINDYQQRVPINDYESLRPYIDRMQRGEPNMLTAENPIFFGLTTGTTSAPKLIPATKYSGKKKAEVTNLWAYYAYKDYPSVIINGKILAIVNTGIKGYTPSGVPYGSETGYGYKNLPWLFRHYYALPYQVFSIKNYAARYYTILRIAMQENVSTVITPNANTIVLLCRRINKWKNKIINDIEKGTLSWNIDVSESDRKTIKKFCKKNPKRAHKLRAILKEKKSLLPKDFWPGMKLIECWKSGTVGLYVKELFNYFGNVPIRDLGYISTESRNSIPTNNEGAGGILAIQSNFYEFIPKEDMNRNEKRVLLCDQLEKGKEYSFIVTTAGGLYRYDMDDIIKVDGFYNKTPVIEFVQKGFNVASLAGEKLYESQVNEAVNRALDKNNIIVKFLSATIEVSYPPHYIFLTEFNGDISINKKRSFLKSIDEELSRCNTLYADKRRAQLLASPVLKIVKKGEYERYRSRKMKRIADDAQFKMPKLTTDEKFKNSFNIEGSIYIIKKRNKKL
ncbi:MAG: GH3 auxin-responsive promoter family protein [Candidatus Omnitrophota bacterium]|nr:MAG: GH3 auxin-responsive promoter family protein [Candidatus Omnitrophota bacterium]